MKKNIEAVENAMTFLEAIGYVSGDVHDDLAAALIRMRKVQASRDAADEAARQSWTRWCDGK